MVRTKIVAVLLGPSGVGLVSLYETTINFAGQLSNLGIQSSAVRQVAEAYGSDDFDRIGRTVLVLRRACWITGLLGWLLTIACAGPLSTWAFGSPERSWALGILGATLLISNVSGGQTALLQGSRRIADLARVMIFSSTAGTLVSLGLYAWLGERGIVPVLLCSAVTNLACSWWFSRRVSAPPAVLKWTEIAREARPLIFLGMAFMWGGLLTAGVAFATRGLITQGMGIEANGIYQAAWGISGLFAGFVLNAMGQDFYPRLTAVAGRNDSVNLLVNEQTEVGILLALPGLLATLAFSPLAVQIFYTGKFIDAALLLPWFVLGVFGRVISWPIGYIQVAKGASITFAVSETTANTLHLLFIWFGLKYWGLVGVAMAFAALYACYSAVLYLIAVRLSGFRWSGAVLRLIASSALLIGAQFCVPHLLAGTAALVASLLLVVCSGVYSLRQLTFRVGPQHPISRLVAAVPGLGRYLKT